MPIYGTLQPGQSEQVSLTFYGHANIASEACAVCSVAGGPSYDVRLKGEASLVSYKFDAQEIHYDKIVSFGLISQISGLPLFSLLTVFSFQFFSSFFFVIPTFLFSDLSFLQLSISSIKCLFLDCFCFA